MPSFQSTPLCEGRRLLIVLSCWIMSFNPRPCARGDAQRKTKFSPLKSFNPRPCARGDAGNYPAYTKSHCFNPRPCARGDSGLYVAPRESLEFQSTPLCEGRPYLIPVLDHSSLVSIHAPVRGATGMWAEILRHLRRFNPRPCARGDAIGVKPMWAFDVSIHAPVRGATRSTVSLRFNRLLFQSTPLCEGRHQL